ncbi:hypothetical protein DFH09DRAFT_1069313 [Mycena vulgaris]|nr:hypothetical protein DFH09DRAFT_1069313 [Mycena vulgaris]
MYNGSAKDKRDPREITSVGRQGCYRQRFASGFGPGPGRRTEFRGGEWRSKAMLREHVGAVPTQDRLASERNVSGDGAEVGRTGGNERWISTLLHASRSARQGVVGYTRVVGDPSIHIQKEMA